VTAHNQGGPLLLKNSGRIRSGDLDELRGQMGGHTGGIILDFEEATLIDVEVVRFLGMCEANGIELVHCSPYIRQWILREQASNEEN
jgi:hypothetical protein